MPAAELVDRRYRDALGRMRDVPAETLRDRAGAVVAPRRPPQAHAADPALTRAAARAGVSRGNPPG